MITPTPEPKSSPVLDELIEKIEQEKLQEEQEPEGGNDVEGSEIKTYTDENGLEILEVDGERYLHHLNILERHKKYVGLGFNAREKILNLDDCSPPGYLNLTPETLKYFDEEIPWYDPLNKGRVYIKYDYYVNTLTPKIEELIK